MSEFALAHPWMVFWMWIFFCMAISGKPWLNITNTKE